MHNKEDPKYTVLREARRLCFNYCIFAVTLPDIFGEDPDPIVSPLAEYLLADPDSDRGLCHDFISEAVSRFEDPENGAEIKNALVLAMEQLSGQLSNLSMNDDYKPYMLAMRNFVRYPPLVVALSQSPSFLADVEPQDIEKRTLLGPFFRLSPMQVEVALNYFSSPTTRDQAYKANSQRSLRMSLQNHQDELFDIANLFIKSSKESRERMLDWFAKCLNSNHKRRAMRTDPKTISSDGFMVNITVVLDRLCEPFMDASFTKIDRIDINYLRRSPRLDISDETKINADQHASDEFYSVKAEGTNNFISEIFFLTVAAHHYGMEAANTKMTELGKDVKWLEKQLEKMEAERPKFLANPRQLAVFDASVKKAKDQIERGHCTILATQGVLLDEVTQARSMLFMRYVIVWLLRLVSGRAFPKEPLHLPLPQEEPPAFKCLPEYFLEDIVDNFKFITRFMPHIVTSTQCEELVMVCITFLRSTEYIKNPYLKAGLVTILFHGVWPFGHRSKGVLGDVLFAHKFATKHLLHALMKFYIECESTGTHTQFYDKFNIRYEIFQVIKCVWPNPIYQENLSTEAR
jgi:ubiquitin conjugation factor E4 B